MIDNETLEIKKITDEAVERGLQNSHQLWREYALECIYAVCLRQEEFTMDEVRDLVRNCEHKTHDLRAMGGIARVAKSNGWCEPIGEMRHSKNRVAHGAAINVWRSLIYKNV